MIASYQSQPFSYTITGLSLNSVYYFRMVFHDAGNQMFATGPIMSLHTQQPQVTTLAATSVTGNSAVLNGTVNPEGDYGGAYFEWGTDPTLTNPTATCSYQYYQWNCPVVANFQSQPFSYTITGLSRHTRYYFRMVFYDGGDQMFTRGPILGVTTLSLAEGAGSKREGLGPR